VTQDEKWMAQALRAARAAAGGGEVPVGALVVRGGRVLGRGANRTITSRDPSAHAEIIALRGAARRTGNHRLLKATLYVTLEPCLMCLGAMVQARIGRLVYAAADPKTGAASLLDRPEVRERTNHRFEVAGGILAQEAGDLLRGFFRARRGAGPGSPAGAPRKKKSRRRAR
jgi:tRNA(adenine34) deaminase